MKTITFDNGYHRRFHQEGRGDAVVQQYYPQATFDATGAMAIERIRIERRDCANLVSELHAAKKLCAKNQDFNGARLLGRLAKEYEGWVKAATWLLGYCGDGPWVHPKDWGHELWPQLDGLINMAELAESRPHHQGDEG